MSDKVETQVQIDRLLEAGVVMDESELAAYLEKPDELGINSEADVPVGFKRCGGCGVIKKFYLFNRNSAAKNKCTGNCKVCQKAAANKSYERNKGKRDYKQYYREHKEIKQAHSKKYYEEHKEEITAKQKAYRATRAGQKVMRKAHRKRARLLRKNTGIPFTREMVIARDMLGNEYPTCYLCNQLITDGKIHLDHVIPVVIGGKDCFTNIACVHETCNLTKSKDAHEITTEQVETIMKRAEQYIEEHPAEFPSIFESNEDDGADGNEETETQEG